MYTISTDKTFSKTSELSAEEQKAMEKLEKGVLFADSNGKVLPTADSLSSERFTAKVRMLFQVLLITNSRIVFIPPSSSVRFTSRQLRQLIIQLIRRYELVLDI